MTSKPAPTTMRLRECELVYRARSVDVCVKRISSSEDVYRLLGAMDASRRVTESMWVLLLDARQKLIGIHECAKGGVTSVPVQLCDVFRAAIIAGAPAVILAHNHPSGDCGPSPEDFVFTDAARNAGKLLGVEVLDHIIVAHSWYYSLLDAGKFRVPPQAKL